MVERKPDLPLSRCAKIPEHKTTIRRTGGGKLPDSPLLTWIFVFTHSLCFQTLDLLSGKLLTSGCITRGSPSSVRKGRPAPRGTAGQG